MRKTELSPIFPKAGRATYSNLFSQLLWEWRYPRNKSTLLALLCLLMVNISSTLVSASKNQIASKVTGFGEPATAAESLVEKDSLFFYLAGLFIAPLFGFLSGITSRRALLLISCAIVGASTMACCLVNDSYQFIFCRTATGVGYGGALPVVMSLLGDWFSGGERQEIIGYCTAVFGMGALIGYVLGHQLGGHWQILFLSVGAIIIAAAVVYTFLASEPARGNAGGPEYRNDEISVSQQIKPLLGPTNLAVYLNSFPGFIPYQLFLNSMKDVVEMDLPMFVVFAVSIFSGSMMGTFAGIRLYKKDPSFVGLYCAFMALLRIVPILVLLSVSSDSAKYICICLTGALLAQHSPILSAMLMSVNMPEARGLSVSICCSCEDLARAVGPTIMGAIGGSLDSRDEQDRQRSILRWSMSIWVVTGLVLAGTSRSLEKDERKIQALEEELTEAAKRRTERKESLDAITSSVMRTREVFKPNRASTTIL